MKKVILWTLHGFLGTLRDFDFLRKLPSCEIRPVDWNSFSWDSLEALGNRTNDCIKSADSINILLGYSFGGRIALHALKNNLSLYQGAIFISTHPGLQDLDEKRARLEKDRLLAKIFLEHPWDPLMTMWNTQPIFSKEEMVFQRDEKDYSREKLANILIKGSLGTQNDFRTLLASWQIPILWLTGENDTRFCQVASSLTFSHPHSKMIIVPEGGHRFPWTRQESFLEHVRHFCVPERCVDTYSNITH